MGRISDRWEDTHDVDCSRNFGRHEEHRRDRRKWEDRDWSQRLRCGTVEAAGWWRNGRELVPPGTWLKREEFLESIATTSTDTSTTVVLIVIL